MAKKWSISDPELGARTVKENIMLRKKRMKYKHLVIKFVASCGISGYQLYIGPQAEQD